MVVLESAALVYGAYKYRKHRKHKKERENQPAVTAPEGIYGNAHEHTPPPSYSTAVLAPTKSQAPLEKQLSSPKKHDDGIPKTLALSHRKMIEEGREWRPVYMLERSTSKTNYNTIRTHRALFVGDFLDGEGVGRAHEIRKERSSSFFGVQLPFGRTMRYTDAEEWVEAKGFDRDPVFLGYTDWTDEELNHEGHKMVDDYPTYSLNYSNCQHFVADLAEKIIPSEKVDNDGMDKTQPTFDKLVDNIASGEYEGHGDAVLNGVAGLTIGAGKQTTKFFHFTKAVMKSIVKLDWRPFDDYNRLLRAENMRAIAAHSREDKRRGPRYISGSGTGGSSASVSTQAAQTDENNVLRPMQRRTNPVT